MVALTRSLGDASSRSGRLGPDVRLPRWASARAHSLSGRSLRSDDLVEQVVANADVSVADRLETSRLDAIGSADENGAA